MKTATTHQATYDTLRDWLISGQFAPGEPVVVLTIAEELGVSTMPVREAIRRLIAENTLELLDNRRVRVPVMTYSRFEQLLDARVALEVLAGERAVHAATPALIEELRAIDQESDKMLDSGDLLGVVGNNFKFHRTIYSSVPSRTLMDLIENIWMQLGPFMITAMQSLPTTYTVDRHVEILDALAARDAVRLRVAISADIRDGIGLLGEKLLEEQAVHAL